MRFIIRYLHALLNFYLCVCFTGCCTFDEPFSSCGYSQSDDDDLNWDQVNTLIKPSSDQWMPSGWSFILLFLFLFDISLCIYSAFLDSIIIRMLLCQNLFNCNT